MASTLQQKAELTKIINGYAEVISELESAGNDLSHEFEQTSPMSIWNGALLESFRAFVNTWRLVMNRQKSAKAQKALEASDVDS